MDLKLEKYFRLIDFDKRLYFTLLCLINMLALFINNELLLTDQIYYQTYGEWVAMERIERHVQLLDQYSWVGYAMTPVMLLLKVSLVSVCINVGTLFADYAIGFKKIFKIALVAEAIFVFTNLLRVLWLTFFHEVNIMQDIQYFYPFSFLSLFDPGTLESWFVYPMATLNLSELLYFLVLAYGLKLALNKVYDKALNLVLGSYGIGLLVWIFFIVFLSINLS